MKDKLKLLSKPELTLRKGYADKKTHIAELNRMCPHRFHMCNSNCTAFKITYRSNAEKGNARDEWCDVELGCMPRGHSIRIDNIIDKTKVKGKG